MSVRMVITESEGKRYAAGGSRYLILAAKSP